MSTPIISIPSIPLRLTANRVWRSYRGGKLLDEMSDVAEPKDAHYPEDWIGSAVEAINPIEHRTPREGVAMVSAADGMTSISQLFEEHAEYFFGAEHIAQFGAQPEFLVKYIDSAERLHFQCHPTKDFSREHLKSSYGKFEAYYVLDVRPDMGPGVVYVGFQRPPERDVLKDMIERQDIDALSECFDPIPVQRGDVIIVPGGVPHALGAGVLLIEILEPSDWVARFEFSRGGYVLPEKDRFMGRDLDFALGMFDLRAKGAAFVESNYLCQPQVVKQIEHGRRERLIGLAQTDCFQVWKTTWSGRAQRTVSSYCIAIVVGGACRLAGPDGWTAELRRFDRVVIPYGMEWIRMESIGECELLECYPPSAKPELETFTV
ncbi:class I mannose-6-phosphate isomerase [Cerasicoccus arenae]|uniref:Phosphomannose isomerase n=1 Tax=Cerasicoccus arenae TaxID=424488 RepID=A0A8J3GD04_9BACT|nr:class I mannose-6-phosphate isomerase [Cerasicoccus arenae]MBK1857950.1 class I mannose-6-phosphate isomerase [Cerasicoccus arenae]GHB97870.1 phosphomannose isomerase [Cerasicoccus arenae]